MTQPGMIVEGGRRRWLGLLSVTLLLSAGVLAWWWYHARGPATVEPPLPADMEDAEVRHAVEKARGRVLENPHSAEAWGRLGMTLLAQLYDREADRCFAEASRLDPSDPRWHFARGQIALKRDPEHALPLLRQAVDAAVASSRQISETRLPLAEALLERGELDEAEKLFQEEQRRNPRNRRAAYGLGLIALERGDKQSALSLFTTARESKPARKRATAQLAALARLNGDTTAADGYEKEAASIPDDPPWPDPFLDSVMELRVGQSRLERDADELEHEQRYADAAKLWLEQLQQHRTCQACTAAGLNLARLQDYDQAMPLLREAVELDPSSAQAHYTLALILFTRAEQEWKHSPGSDSARAWLRECITHARRATELKGDYAQAYLFWGAAYKYLGEPATAIPPLRQGVACQPNSFDLQFTLGEVLLAAGQKAEAKQHLENAQRIDPDDSRVPDLLARLIEKKP